MVGTVWYGILDFNVPLDTVHRRRGGGLSSDVHLSFSNGPPPLTRVAFVYNGQNGWN